LWWKLTALALSITPILMPNCESWVKYRENITWQDTYGVRSFIEKSVYNAPFGIIVTLTDEPATDDPRLVSIPLSTLLLMR